VYFGDAITGVPMAGYDDATVTLNWTVTPVPEPGTFAFVVLGAGLLVLSRQRLGRLVGLPEQCVRCGKGGVRK
jgi:hypothetical protein